jgi:predicted SprT family Zn-dependent metalloprotease
MAATTFGRNTRFKDIREIRAEHEEEIAEEAIAEARESAENRYCDCRKSTAKHTVEGVGKGKTYTCQSCGSVKYDVRFIREVMRPVGS